MKEASAEARIGDSVGSIASWSHCDDRSNTASNGALRLIHSSVARQVGMEYVVAYLGLCSTVI
jgi:hypothetical protein